MLWPRRRRVCDCTCMDVIAIATYWRLGPNDGSLRILLGTYRYAMHPSYFKKSSFSITDTSCLVVSFSPHLYHTDGTISRSLICALLPFCRQTDLLPRCLSDLNHLECSLFTILHMHVTSGCPCSRYRSLPRRVVTLWSAAWHGLAKGLAGCVAARVFVHDGHTVLRVRARVSVFVCARACPA